MAPAIPAAFQILAIAWQNWPYFKLLSSYARVQVQAF